MVTGKLLPFPLVDCLESHGPPLPGYLICRHLLVSHSIVGCVARLATRADLGAVVCRRCAPSDLTWYGRLICAHDARDRFGVELPEVG